MSLIPFALTLPSLLVLAAPQDDEPESPTDPFVRTELSTEVDLLVLHVPDAKSQSAFVIYPRGFFSDQKGAPQSSHLAEHLVIRATDPEVLMVDGVRLNGETQGATLRLEALGPVEAWPTVVDRISRWMNGAKGITSELLDVERERMAEEIQSTAPRGFTGKWAQAGWLQAVRHGAPMVLVRDGLIEFDVGRARTFVGWHVRNSRPVKIVVAGPREPEKVAEDFAESLTGLPAWGTGTSIAAFGMVNSTWKIPTGDHAAEWDLPGSHYIEWYTLAGSLPKDRAAGELLAAALSGSLQRAGVARKGTYAAVTLEQLSLGTWALWISFAPEVGIDPAEVREALDEELATFLEQPGDRMLGNARMMKTAQPLVPDFAAVRKQMAGRPGAEFIEAQVALNLADPEVRLGITAVEFRRLATEQTAEAFHGFAVRALDADRRGTLWLRPQE